MEIFLPQSLGSTNPCPIFVPSSHFLLDQYTFVSHSPCHCRSFSQETRIQKSIICARNKKRQHLSARSRKLVIESAYLIASRLKILPEPLDYLIREFGIGGANGGGGFRAFWKGSGWGGFDGWGRGRGRRKKRSLEFLAILVISGIGFWLVLGKQLDADLFLGFLGLVLFGLSVDGWRNGIKDWALGFCCCAFLVGLVLRREDFPGGAKSFGTMILSKRRRKGRVF
ncbi:uncharacterized protein LOC113762914 [Coffea eugenioides]|uniref:uncharacterized protein LOC113762914 n=1 Tax=Coffea eugenioides TaxID=49369 RepID=UPI000F60ECE6|nr:uncharacterized protein LOC113762914 [Coffea eugenioides]